MSNIMDYLEWRGDLSFKQDGFNEIDNLVLSILAYLEFDGIVPEVAGQDSISIFEIAQHHPEPMNRFALLEHNPLFKNIPGLFFMAAKSGRYSDVKLSHYVNLVDDARSEQFSAVVFSIDDEQHFIAYRGTDDTIIGWKEDFQMSFKSEVPAQKHAVIYMNRIFADMPGKFYLGGHSKGGNLAVYAATHASQKMRDRIVGIYNNDGPGFQPSVVQSQEYQRMLGKITTLIPESSVVGMLLEHGGNYKVIGSSETGIMQHNAFSWQVKGPQFVYKEGLAQSSVNLSRIVRSWLDQLSVEQRAQFVDAIFDIICATGAKTVAELSREKLTLSIKMIKTYQHLDPQTRSHLNKIIRLFFRESQKTLTRSISTNLNLILSKKQPGVIPVKSLRGSRRG